MELPHRLDRTILIEAPRETVFRYFTDNTRWSAWWGAGSTIDARPGGRVLIRYPNAVEATGEVVEVSPPERIIFTYGYAPPALPPPGGSPRHDSPRSRGARDTAASGSRIRRCGGARSSRAGVAVPAVALRERRVRRGAARRTRTCGQMVRRVGRAGRRGTTAGTDGHRVSRYPPSRSLQLRGRDRRAHRAHRCGTAVHARRQDEGRRRSAPVPGHGPRRVDRDGRRRATAIPRHERVRVRPRWTDRIRDGLLVTAGVRPAAIHFASVVSSTTTDAIASAAFAGSVMENPDAPGFTSSLDAASLRSRADVIVPPNGRHLQLAVCRPVEHVQVQLALLCGSPDPTAAVSRTGSRWCRRSPRRSPSSIGRSPPSRSTLGAGISPSAVGPTFSR